MNDNEESQAKAPSETASADAARTGPAEERIAELQAEVDKQKDAHLRALAETENLRRRMTREKEEAVRYASSSFARELLSVADNLRRALEAVPETEAKSDIVRNLMDGVAATERELLSVFEKNGVKRIDPLDQKFDHNFHQAMFEVENTGKPPGTVVQVLQSGYVQHDRLLRPAMVGVAKGEKSGNAGDARVDTTA